MSGFALRKSFWLAATLLMLLSSLNVMATDAQQEWVYTARPNDTLQSIADKYLMPDREWHELVRHNRIQDGSGKLKAGTLINIPVSWLKHYPKPAEVLAIQGDVRLRYAHSTSYIPALTGTRLNIGDELKTLEGSALVKFADGSRLSIAERSIVIFNTLTHYSETGMVDTRFRLLKGHIETTVTPRKGPAARYEVSTPSAVAAVRGTAFRMTATATVTVTEVTEGTVEIRNDSASRSLTKGQGARISQNVDITTLSLLPAPEVSTPGVMTTLPFRLSWPVLDGAVAYRAELYDTSRESLPILTSRLEATNIELPRLNNGDYLLRIRGIADDGLEGVNTEVRFSVDQKAMPAKLTRPLSGASLDSPNPNFEWTVEAPYMLSSLEIATDERFSDLYSRTPFASVDNATSERPLAAGQYYWRVVTLVGGDNFSYSEARPVTIQGRLDSTEVIAVNYLPDNEQAKVFWKTVPNATGYRLQLAEDELFTRIVREVELNNTSANLKLVPEKTYWVRIRPEGNELYSSEFGESQIIRLHSE